MGYWIPQYQLVMCHYAARAKGLLMHINALTFGNTPNIVYIIDEYMEYVDSIINIT